MYRFIFIRIGFLFWLVVMNASEESLSMDFVEGIENGRVAVSSEASERTWFQKMQFWMQKLQTPFQTELGQKPVLPEKIMLQEMVWHAMDSLERYRGAQEYDCWTLSDWQQFELTYNALDRITQRFADHDSSLRRYFRILQVEVRTLTEMGPGDYIQRERRRVKGLNRDLGCQMSL